MEALKIDISRQGQTCILSLAGPLTARQVACLRRASFQTDATGHCVLDLSALEEIDGYGLSALVGILARYREHGGRVVLCGINPVLRASLEATFCDALFTLRSDLEGALMAVEESPR
jgi:anti-anti-sigma factor